jgi:hypothetical protein
VLDKRAAYAKVNYFESFIGWIAMRIKRVVFGAILSLGTIFAAPAVAIPVTDIVNPTDTTITSGSTPSPCPLGFTCSSGSLSFVHDITDNGFTLGSIVTAASLAIHLMDDTGSEGYTFNVGAAQTFSSVNVPGGAGSTDTFALNAASIADLLADGKITVTVNATSGSFAFADSTLIAQVTVGPSATVPEPGILALLSLALAALASTKRRRNSRS